MLVRFKRYHVMADQVQYVHNVSSDQLRVHFIGGETVDLYGSVLEVKEFIKELNKITERS